MRKKLLSTTILLLTSLLLISSDYSALKIATIRSDYPIEETIKDY